MGHVAQKVLCLFPVMIGFILLTIGLPNKNWIEISNGAHFGLYALCSGPTCVNWFELCSVNLSPPAPQPAWVCTGKIPATAAMGIIAATAFGLAFLLNLGILFQNNASSLQRVMIGTSTFLTMFAFMGTVIAVGLMVSVINDLPSLVPSQERFQAFGPGFEVVASAIPFAFISLIAHVILFKAVRRRAYHQHQTAAPSDSTPLLSSTTNEAPKTNPQLPQSTEAVWGGGLFGCVEGDCDEDCLLSFVVPCIPAGQNFEDSAQGDCSMGGLFFSISFLFGCAQIFLCWQRDMLYATFRRTQATVADVFAVFFCTPCALAQDRRGVIACVQPKFKPEFQSINQVPSFSPPSFSPRPRWLWDFSRDDSTKKLEQAKVGDFMVCPSDSVAGQFRLSVRGPNSDKPVTHHRVNVKDSSKGKLYSIETKKNFPSVEALVSHYVSTGAFGLRQSWEATEDRTYQGSELYSTNTVPTSSEPGWKSSQGGAVRANTSQIQSTSFSASARQPLFDPFTGERTTPRDNFGLTSDLFLDSEMPGPVTRPSAQGQKPLRPTQQTDVDSAAAFRE